MKTKNQTEQNLLELAVKSAANEDGISSADSRDAALVARKETAQKTAWSPYEVWRTRVKTSARPAERA
jgi:hypothetical protein